MRQHRLVWIVSMLMCEMLCGSAVTICQTSIKANDEKPAIRTYGIKINVDDMDKALAFYSTKLGFELSDRSQYPQQVSLKTSDRVKLILYKVSKLCHAPEQATQASFTLQVNNLDQAIARMKTLGIPLAEMEPRKEGVGFAISIRDPFGRRISMMHQTIVKVEPFKEPQLYNFGYAIPDMSAARDFYSVKLGFVARSEKYLPLDLPLGHADKSFAFMLHYRPGIKPFKSRFPEEMPFNMVIYETANLHASISEFKKLGVKILGKGLQKGPQGNSIYFEDPFGNVSELLEPAP
jgi:predicted enzyme related to lactoylglutathione lyase